MNHAKRWQVDPEPVGGISGGLDTRSWSVVTDDHDVEEIAVVYDEDDAKLVAAAPELLEALKGMVALYRVENGYDAKAGVFPKLFIPEARYNDARTAINKAEGRKP